MYFLYALYSDSFDKIYIGYSADPEARLNSHNSPLNKGWTASFRPWRIVYVEPAVSKKKALIREKQLKSFQGRNFIRSLVKTRVTWFSPPTGG